MIGFSVFAVLLVSLANGGALSYLGATVWSYSTQDFAPPPYTATSAGMTMVMESMNSTLRGFNTSTGNEYWRIQVPCQDPVSVNTLGAGSQEVIVTCSDVILFLDVAAGAVVRRAALPAGLLASLIIQSQQYVVVVQDKFIVVSVQVGATGAFGVGLLRLSDFTFVSSQAECLCNNSQRVTGVFGSSSDPGFFTTCGALEVLFQPWPGSSAAAWSYTNTSMMNPSVVAYSEGSSSSNIAIAFQDGYSSYVCAFTMGGDSIPKWITSIPASLESGGTPMLIACGETLVLSMPYSSGTFALVNGNIIWNISTSNLLSMECDVQMGENLLLTTSDSSYEVVSLLSGASIVPMANLPFNANGPTYTLLVPFSAMTVSHNSSVVTTLPSQNMLALVSAGNMALFDLTNFSCTWFVSSLGQSPLPPVVVTQLFPQFPSQAALVIPSFTELTIVSLSGFSWNILNLLGSSVQGGTVFAVDSQVQAYDRNGVALWNTPPTVNAEICPFVAPFTFDTMLVAVDDSTAIAAINTYTGEQVATLLIPSSCNTTISSDSPVLSGVAVNALYQNAYVAAKLPCLLHIHADLTFSSLPLDWVVSNAPVIDNDNGFMYTFTGHQLFSVPINGNTKKPSLIAAFENEITEVIPSSTFGNVNKGLNPLVYVFTSQSVSAVDVQAVAGHGTAMTNRVWTLPLLNINAYLFFNNSLYTLSTGSGIARISLDPAATNRVIWSLGAYQVETAGSMSNIVVSPDGVLLFMLDADLYAIDAYSGRARWSQNGFVSLDQACTMLNYAAEVFVLFAACGPSVIALDAAASNLQNPPVLFSVNANNVGAMTYNHPTLFLSPGTLDVGSIIAINVPPFVSSRLAVYPTAAPTQAPQVETLAPGFTPVPVTPSPYQPSYPTYSPATTPVATVGQLFPNTNGDATTSVFGPPTTLPNQVFLAPYQASNQGPCTVASANVSSGQILWWTSLPVSSENCFNLVSAISVGGQTAATSVVVVLVNGGNIAAYNAQTGAFMWNTTGFQYADVVLSTSGPGATHRALVLAVNATNVNAYDALSGALLVSLPTSVSPQPFPGTCQTQLYHPLNNMSAILEVTGENGMEIFAFPFTDVKGGSSSIFTATYDQLPLNCQSPIFTASQANAVDSVPLVSGQLFGLCVRSDNASNILLFEVSLNTGKPAEICNISIGSSQLLSFITDGVSSLYFATTSGVYKVSTSGQMMMHEPIPVNFGTSLSLVSNMLLVWNGNADTVVAFNMVTGQNLWSAPTGLYQSQELPSALPAILLPNNVLVLCAGGIVALNASSGSIQWLGHVQNPGIPRSLTLPTVLDFVAIDGSSSPAIQAVFATFHRTTYAGTYGIVLPADASPAAQTCYSAVAFSMFPFPNADLGVGIAGVDFQAGSYLLTNFVWTTVLPSEATPVVLTTSTGTQIIVIVAEFTVIIFNGETGAIIANMYRSESCPESAGEPLQTSGLQMQVVGNSLVFVDTFCLYRVSADTQAMVAVPLSTTIIFDSTIYISNDNQTAFLTSGSSGGFVAAIDLVHTQLLWISDFMNEYGYSVTSVLPLPYGPAVTRMTQQVLVICTSGVVSLSVSSGTVLFVELFGMTYNSVNAAPTIDGNALVLADGNAILINLALSTSQQPTNRTKWTMELGILSPTWTVVLPVPHSTLVLASYQGTSVVLAIDTNAAAVVWETSCGGMQFATALFLEYPTSSTGNQPPPFVMFSGYHTSVLAVATGTLIFFHDEGLSITSPPMLSGIIPLSIEIGSPNFCLAPVMLPRAVTRAPTVAGSAPGTIPVGYSYTVPLPGSKPAKPLVSGLPSPLALWKHEQPNDIVTIADATLADGTPIILSLVLNSSVQVTNLVALDAVTGSQIGASQPFPLGCQLNNLITLTASYTAVECYNNSNSESILYIVDTTTVSLSIKGHVTLNDYLNSPASIPVIQASQYGCFATNSYIRNAVIICISLSSSTFGKVTRITCPSGQSFAASPSSYYDGEPMMLTACASSINSSVTAYSLSSTAMSSVWNVPFVYETISAVDFPSTGPTWGVIFYEVGADSPNSTFQVYSYSDAELVANTTIYDIGTMLSSFVFLETKNSTGGAEYLLFLGANSQLWAFSSNTGDAVWSLYFDMQQDSSLFLSTSPSTKLPVLYYASYNYTNYVPALYALDPLTGATISQVLFTGSEYDYGYVFGKLLSNNSLIALQMNMGALVVIDLVSFSVVLGIAKAVSASNFVSTVSVDGLHLLNVAETHGVAQFILAAASSNPVLVDQFAVVQSASTDYIVARRATTATTYLLNASGSVLWGVTILSGSSYSSATYRPEWFSVLNSGGVLFQLESPRSYYGLAGHSGMLVYYNTLELCEGQGSGDMFATVADHVNSAMYVVIGNPCLYRVDALTGQGQGIFVGGTELLDQVVLSPSCILTLDSYHMLVCTSRTTLTPLWNYTGGFATETSDTGSLQVSGSLVFLRLSDQLLCFAESTGILIWEERVGPSAMYTFYNNSVFVVSQSYALAISMNPATSTAQVAWRLSLAPYTAVNSLPPSSKRKPFVAVNGVLIATVSTWLLGINVATGAVTFSVALLVSCSSILYQSFGPGNALNNVFFAECGRVDVRSVVTGLTIANIGESGSNGCSANGLQFVAQTSSIAFCNLNNMMDVQPLPAFVAAHSAVAPVLPTAAPIAFTIPPGPFTPQGAQTPMPVVPGSAAFPNLDCMLNIEAIYPSISTCLMDTLTTAYSTNGIGGSIECHPTGIALLNCVADWLSQATCNGASVYVNTVLSSLNTSGALDFCGQPSRCTDGPIGAEFLCSVVNVVDHEVSGEQFPPQYIAMLPSPANNLPTFNVGPVPTTPPATTTIAPTQGSVASKSLGTGEIAGIAIAAVVVVVVLVLAVYRRVQHKREAPYASVGAVALNAETFSMRGSELDSLPASKSRFNVGKYDSV